MTLSSPLLLDSYRFNFLSSTSQQRETVPAMSWSWDCLDRNGFFFALLFAHLYHRIFHSVMSVIWFLFLQCDASYSDSFRPFFFKSHFVPVQIQFSRSSLSLQEDDSKMQFLSLNGTDLVVSCNFNKDILTSVKFPSHTNKKCSN